MVSTSEHIIKTESSSRSWNLERTKKKHNPLNSNSQNDVGRAKLWLCSRKNSIVMIEVDSSQQQFKRVGVSHERYITLLSWICEDVNYQQHLLCLLFSDSLDIVVPINYSTCQLEVLPFVLTLSGWKIFELSQATERSKRHSTLDSAR